MQPSFMVHEDKSVGQAKCLLMAKGEVDKESAVHVVHGIKVQMESGKNEQAIAWVSLFGGLFTHHYGHLLCH